MKLVRKDLRNRYLDLTNSANLSELVSHCEQCISEMLRRMELLTIYQRQLNYLGEKVVSEKEYLSAMLFLVANLFSLC